MAGINGECVIFVDIFLIIFFLVGSAQPAFFIGRLVMTIRRDKGLTVYTRSQFPALGITLLFFSFWNGMLLSVGPWCWAPYAGYPLGILIGLYGAQHNFEEFYAECNNEVGALGIASASGLQPTDTTGASKGGYPHHASSFPSAPPPPPPGYSAAWEKFNDPKDNKPYWHNATTGETTWDDPT